MCFEHLIIAEFELVGVSLKDLERTAGRLPDNVPSAWHLLSLSKEGITISSQEFGRIEHIRQ
jgi:hypothetical protein